MCGIAGIVELKEGHRPDHESLHKMCHLMEKRGPDEQGVHIEGAVGFGMRRLSIIDLEKGQQPIFNETGSKWVVCNGEIYNYRDLRDELERFGHVFETNSDTEVVVHAYEQFGVEFLKRLEGMFGLAIWDTDEQLLLLARDRVGIKPLCYYHDNRRLIFASELTAIINNGIPDLDLQIDKKSLNQFMIYGNFPSPHTPFHRCHKVLPGHYLKLKQGKVEEVSYWDVNFETGAHDSKEDDWLDEFDCLLKASVDRHLLSDVPIGAFLSGGVDSSVVVARTAKQYSGHLSTFSIGFEESSFDESRYARQVAEHFGCKHHDYVINRESIKDEIFHIMGTFDEPFFDTSGIPTYYVSKLAGEHVKVVLSGDGGDELFAGYKHYTRFQQHHGHLQRRQSSARLMLGLYNSLLARWPGIFLDSKVLRHAGDHLIKQNQTCWTQAVLHFYERIPYHYRTALQREVLSIDEECEYIEKITAQSTNEDVVVRLSEFDFFNYLPNDILTKVDRMSMSNSLEVRVPLLDHSLVEFAARIPLAYKRKEGVDKYLLKRHLSSILAKDNELYGTITREKHGFRFPIGEYLNKDFRQYICDGLLSRDYQQEMGFSDAAVRRMLSGYEAGWCGGKPIWILFCLYLWWDRNLRRH